MTKQSTTSIIKYTIFAGIFIIPFIFLFAPSDPGVANPGSIFFFSNSFFFPFITSKAFVFRIIVEIMFALWLLLILRDKQYVPKFSWLTVTITAFTFIALIADLLGLNPLRSIWSNFERMEGWLAIIHIWAFFIILSSVLSEKVLWHRFFKISLFVAVCVSVYGIIQIFGGAMIHQGSTRIDASLGNAIYLAVYMLFHFFISLYLLVISWGKKQHGRAWVYAILAVLFGFIIFETATRGTLIGLVGGGLLTLLILAIFDKEHKSVRIASASIIAAILLFTVLFYANKDANFIQNNETLRRMASISWQDTKTQARGFIWPMAVNSILESPKSAVIGIGQENFNYIFNENYNPRMWNQEQWFDRAHNIYLDWLVAGGILGLLSYLSLFVFALWAIWKSSISVKEKAILVGLFVGYAIHNIFVFDNLASYVYFAGMLAFVHFLNHKEPISWIEKRINLQSENWTTVRDYAFAPVLGIVLVVTVYFINVRPIQANLRLVDALQVCSSPSAASSVEFYKKALALDQYMANQETREQIISCANNVIGGQYSLEQKQNFLNLLSEEVKKQIEATPNDARVYVLAGSFFNSLGDREQAVKLLEKAHELSPRKQSINFQLASAYINEGSIEKALPIFKEAYEGDPTYDVARSSYLSSLVVAGMENEARKIFGDEPALYEDQRIGQMYASLKNYPKAIEFYRKLLLKNPKDINISFQIAQVQYLAGQRADAVATMRRMINDYPENIDLKTQLEQMIREIEAGR